MQSPCNQTCNYNPQQGRCQSCGRSLDEITHWSSYSDHERADIMGQLATRLRTDAKGSSTANRSDP